jgi:hypothetical protein
MGAPQPAPVPDRAQERSRDLDDTWKFVTSVRVAAGATDLDTRLPSSERISPISLFR